MSKLIRDKIHSTPLYREPFICMCSRKKPHNQDIRRTIQGKDQVIYCLSAEKCDHKKAFDDQFCFKLKGLMKYIPWTMFGGN